jgi:hypothetical protein
MYSRAESRDCAFRGAGIEEDTKLENDIVEMSDSNESDQNIYPSLVTGVLVGVGLALAVFLVF